MSETRPLVMRATFTLAAAARELEVSRSTLYKWIRAGAVRLVYVGPPTNKIPRVSIEEINRLKAS